MGVTGTCACYFCDGNAIYQIWLAGEDEQPEETYACEIHARGHVHRAIVLPEQFAAADEPPTTPDLSPPL
jgi:hypothetical protein